MNLFDNDTNGLSGTLVVKNDAGEIGKSHDEQWSIDNEDAASITPSEDGKSAKVFPKNLGAGSDPVAVTVTCKWKNEAEEEKTSQGVFTVVNQPANVGVIDFVAPGTGN